MLDTIFRVQGGLPNKETSKKYPEDQKERKGKVPIVVDFFQGQG